MYDKEIEEKLRKEVLEFTPSTINEIKELNLKIGDSAIIQCIETCPFSNLSYVSDEKYAEIFDMSFQESEFDFCLYFTNDYGNDGFSSPENVKIIEKINKEKINV